MKKKTESPVTQDSLPVEVLLRSERVGTLIWLLPDELSKEFHALPRTMQSQILKVIAARLNHITVMTVGLLMHPELERSFGPQMDRNLAELADLLASAVEHPRKPE
jgi:hypothetical protein